MIHHWAHNTTCKYDIKPSLEWLLSELEIMWNKLNPRWFTKYSRIFSQHNLILKRELYFCADLQTHPRINRTQRAAEKPRAPCQSPTADPHVTGVTPSLCPWPPHRQTPEPTQGRRDDSKKWKKRGCTHSVVTHQSPHQLRVKEMQRFLKGATLHRGQLTNSTKRPLREAGKWLWAELRCRPSFTELQVTKIRSQKGDKGTKRI